MSRSSASLCRFRSKSARSRKSNSLLHQRNLITNHSLLEQLRRNAYATAQIYSWAKIAQKNLGLYEQACQQKCDR